MTDTQKTNKETANFLMHGNISIKTLYEIAKQEGFENSQVFFSVEKIDGTKHSQDVTLNELFKYWKANNELLDLKLNVIPNVDNISDEDFFNDQDFEEFKKTRNSSTNGIQDINIEGTI
jgi:hypothetical protein